MNDISRRFFLGGAISLVAAVTFKPALSSNMPTIYRDGINDDSAGLQALFENNPVIFSKDHIGVNSHDGITFHEKTPMGFIVNNTINIPKNCKLKIERATFVGKGLPDGWPFFMCDDFSGHQFSSTGIGTGAIFKTKPGFKGKLIDYRKDAFNPEFEEKFGR